MIANFQPRINATISALCYNDDKIHNYPPLMPERRPFPEIARFPKQDAIPAEGLEEVEAEPPLEGAPHNELESVILQTPELAQTLNRLQDFNSAPTTKESRAIAEQFSNRILHHPDLLPQDLDALELIGETQGYKGVDAFSKTIVASLERAQFPEFPPKTKALEQWLTISAESAVYGPLAEAMLKRMTERCKDPASISKFLYELSTAGLMSSNPNIVRKTLEILVGQTSIFTPGSEQMLHSILASFDPDDHVLKRTMEIDGAMTFLAHNTDPELLAARDATNDRVAESPDFMQGMRGLFQKYPKRMDDLSQFYNNPIARSGLAVLPADAAKRMSHFPYTLILQNPGPLRIWLNERMASELQRHGDFRINASLPNYEGIIGIESLEDVIQQRLQEPYNGPPVSDQRFWETLTYLFPNAINDLEQFRDFTAANETLRTEMKQASHHLLSPRGDEVEITDDELRALGFRSALYAMNPKQKRETDITLVMGDGRYTYRARLDEYFALRHSNTGDAIQLPTHGAFLEHVLLSHLHEIRCTGTAKESVEGKPGNGPERKVGARRAHRRVLAEGQKPTPEQIAIILSEYEIDLVRWNREREATGETRKVTYVMESKNDDERSTPVHSRSVSATKRLHELLEALQPEK